MTIRSRTAITMALAAVMLLASASTVLAAPSQSLIRSLRAEQLASRSSAGTGVRSASVEASIPVAGTAWYTGVDGLQHFDGYFTDPASGMFQDVWVMIEFKDDMGMTVGTEEVLANEYVVEGTGSWSAKFAMLPAGATHAEAMVYGTPTTRMAFMPESFTTTPSIHLLAAGDRHVEGAVTYGMIDMATDPTLTGLVVAVAEDHMGAFHDVAVGGSTSTTSTALPPGIGTPWRAFGGRWTDMDTDLRFVHYSAVEYSALTAKASTTVPAYGAAVSLTGVVSDSMGMPVAGMPVKALTAAGAVAGQAVTGADGKYAIVVRPTVKTAYTVASLGSSYVGSASSAAPIAIDPKVSVTTPSAPSTAYRNRYFTSTGYLKPRHTAGTYPVLIKAYLKANGKWVLKKTIKAKASNYGSYSKYTARYYLPTRGSWKLVATHDSSAHYPSASGNRYLTVR